MIILFSKIILILFLFISIGMAEEKYIEAIVLEESGSVITGSVIKLATKDQALFGNATIQFEEIKTYFIKVKLKKSGKIFFLEIIECWGYKAESKEMLAFSIEKGTSILILKDELQLKKTGITRRVETCSLRVLE